MPLSITDVRPMPDPAIVDRVIALIRDGQPLSAAALWPGFEAEAPNWMDAKSLTTAARLIDRLGDAGKAHAWHRLNFRRHRDDEVCFTYRASELAGTLGVPAVLQMIDGRLLRPDIEPRRRADLLAAAAGFLAAVRDFDRADDMLREAMMLRPDAEWLFVVKANLLRGRDRRDEALEAATQALSIRPASPHAIECTAALLVELNRDEEAESLLRNGCNVSEAADLRFRLYSFTSERDRVDEALHWLAEYERHSPLLSDAVRKRVEGNRAGLYLQRGDLDAARTSALACGGQFFERMAANLVRPEAAAGRRIRLPVGFVRQHHMTCAPATLSALAAFWGRSAPHTEIAGKICYDGTSNYSERTWAAGQGLDGREFTVTPEIARALVSRGIPFTLVTPWTTGAHLQAVIGTDDRAGFLLIRDPTYPHYAEALLEGFLTDYAAHGPRGMLVLPAEEAHRLDGLELPEAALHDRLHQVEAALQRHDRAAAEKCYEELRAAAPDHRLTWSATFSLAIYDDNPVRSHEAMVALARLFPDDAVCAWRAFRSNVARRTREESLAELERRTRSPKCDSVFTGELARLLALDDRTARRAFRLAQRLCRSNPGDAQSLTTMAQCLRSARRFDEAVGMYRMAACVADKNEVCASNYFSVCRELNRAEEGIAFLRRRFVQLGDLSSGPAITLASSLQELLRTDEALAVIRDARRRRPEDGQLILHEAGIQRSLGAFVEAQAILKSAWRSVPDSDWYREAAILSRAQGSPEHAAQFWKKVLEIEPLSMPAHENVVSLVAESEGFGPAVEWLHEACERYPWHMGLARLHVIWLRRDRRAGATAELERILAHNPADDWAWRELALEHSARERHAEARQAAGEALQLTPQLAGSHWTMADVLHEAGHRQEAHAACRRALELDINCGAMDFLMSAADSASERAGDVAFLRAELIRQTAGGEAVAQFHEVAVAFLSATEMTALLTDGNRARPDIWETWSTLAVHLLNRQDAAAMDVTRGMIERFPAAPGSWRLHSHACGAAGLRDEQMSAMRHAVTISPQWSLAVRELAELLERAGRPEEALNEMRRITRANPLDPVNQGILAEMLIRQDRCEDAIAALEQAVAVEPGYSWGWGELSRQCRAAGFPDRVMAAARKLTESRPDEPRSWINLVEIHGRFSRWDEAMAVTDKALVRWPENVRLNELRAQIFAATGRRQEAIEACSSTAFGDRVPRELTGRRAALLMDGADYAAAEVLLNQLIASEPDYAWPRSLLYDLHRDRKENDRCLTLAEDLVRIEPSNVIALGMLAESLIIGKQPAEAMKAVRRAMQLDPGYSYASARMFDDCLERRDFPGAEEILALMSRFQKGPQVELARARLAMARSDFSEALHAAEVLIRSDEEGAQQTLTQLLESWESEANAPKERMAELLRTEFLEGRAKNPAAGVALAGTWRQKPLARTLREAAAMPVPASVRDRLIAELLYQATDGGARAAALQGLRDHRELMRSSTQLWGAASYVLFQTGERRELIEWCQDWKARADREPWMVSNLALALVWECGPLAASEPWEEVLRAGGSSVWSQAAAGLAFTCAVRGQAAEARRHLGNLKGHDLQNQDAFSVAMAKAALVAADVGRGRRNKARAEELMKLASAAWPDASATHCGRHYLTALQHYLAKNNLDPAFGRLRMPKAARKSFLDSISPGVIVVIIGIAISLFRNRSGSPSPQSDFSSPPSNGDTRFDPNLIERMRKEAEQRQRLKQEGLRDPRQDIPRPPSGRKAPGSPPSRPPGPDNPSAPAGGAGGQGSAPGGQTDGAG